jgi:hypothetical protein
MSRARDTELALSVPPPPMRVHLLYRILYSESKNHFQAVADGMAIGTPLITLEQMTIKTLAAPMASDPWMCCLTG